MIGREDVDKIIKGRNDTLRSFRIQRDPTGKVFHFFYKHLESGELLETTGTIKQMESCANSPYDIRLYPDIESVRGFWTPRHPGRENIKVKHFYLLQNDNLRVDLVLAKDDRIFGSSISGFLQIEGEEDIRKIRPFRDTSKIIEL